MHFNCALQRSRTQPELRCWGMSSRIRQQGCGAPSLYCNNIGAAGAAAEERVKRLIIRLNACDYLYLWICRLPSGTQRGGLRKGSCAVQLGGAVGNCCLRRGPENRHQLQDGCPALPGTPLTSSACWNTNDVCSMRLKLSLNVSLCLLHMRLVLTRYAAAACRQNNTTEISMRDAIGLTSTIPSC